VKGRGLRIAATLGATLAAAAVLLAANNRMLLSGGSDALSTVLAPSPVAQAAMFCLLVVLAVAAAWLRGAGRLIVCVAWLALLLLASHRVVIDRASLEVRDLWLMAPVQRLALPDDQDAGLDATAGPWTLHLAAPPDAAMTVLSGPPGLGLDTAPLLRR